MAVNINSVQAEVHQMASQLLKKGQKAGLLSLHPNYAVDQIKPENPDTKYNLLTGYEVSDQKMRRILPIVREAISHTPHHTLVDLRDESIKIGEKEFSGCELHDYALTAYQILPHMVRMCFDDEEFFEVLQRKIIVTREFSERLIAENPIAKKIFKKYFLNKNFLGVHEAVSLLPEIIKELGFNTIDKSLQRMLQTLNYKKLLEISITKEQIA